MFPAPWPAQTGATQRPPPYAAVYTEQVRTQAKGRQPADQGPSTMIRSQPIGSLSTVTLPVY